MKVQENVIKKEAKRIDNGQWTVDNVILLHWKNASPKDKWYPWFIEEVKKRDLSVVAPHLPNSDNPVLEERLQVLDSLEINTDTCVVAHSRWWVALLRWIETRKKPIWKIILVGTNDSVYTETQNGFFSDVDYAYEVIRTYCANITVLHSQDDQTVPFAHWEKIATWLHANKRFPNGYGHFWRNLNWSFGELLNFVFPKSITTPRSLRLDSKKYAVDAQEFQHWVSDLKPDLFVVIAYGHIMPQWVLDIPVFWSINIHGSLLPEYRGASPLQSVFLDGKSETGITVMKMDAWVDTGGMIKKLTTPLSLHRTVIDLIEWIKNQWPAFLNNVLRDWCKWLLDAQSQDNQKATLCRKFEKEDGLIDPFHDSVRDIRKKRQAFALWPKLYFYLDEKRISIDWLILQDEITWDSLDEKPLFTNNSIHPAVSSIRLTPEGKKPLSREEFVNWFIK